MTADLTQLSRLFSRAADHIARVGLAKDDYINGRAPATIADSPVCTVGAISWALTGCADPDDNPILTDAVRFLSGHLPGEPGRDADTGEVDYVNHVAAWNDEPERTSAGVAAFLHRMAVDACECRLLCQRIAEHDDHEAGDWCPKDKAAYQRELAQLHLEAAA